MGTAGRPEGAIPVVFFILLVAVVNLGLGFALAVVLAHQCESQGFNGSSDPFLSGLASRPEATKTVVVDVTQAAQVAEAAAEAAPVVPETPEPVAEEPELPAREPSSNEASVLSIQDVVKGYNQRLMELSDLFRTPPEEAGGDWFEEHRRTLRTANADYLQARDTAFDAFESLHKEVEEYQAIRGTLKQVMMLQATKTGEANMSIDAYRYQGDLKEGCRRMLGETAKLTDLNHQMRDALEETLVGLARHENWLETSDENARTDALTGLTNRIGLEASLAEWWSRDPHRVRQLNVALLDLDHFGKVNERQGQKAADSLLRALGQVLGSECAGSSLTARYSGQRFVVLFPDQEIRVTANAVERIRQIVETIHFDHGEEDIQVTMSCGVTEATNKDTSESLLERADITVREAKRSGRNRTYLHDGKLPTPMLPPNLTLPDRRITLE